MGLPIYLPTWMVDFVVSVHGSVTKKQYDHGSEMGIGYVWVAPPSQRCQWSPTISRWWFQPIWKKSQTGSFPQVVVKITTIWNHQLDLFHMCLALGILSYTSLHLSHEGAASWEGGETKVSTQPETLGIPGPMNGPNIPDRNRFENSRNHRSVGWLNHPCWKIYAKVKLDDFRK